MTSVLTASLGSRDVRLEMEISQGVDVNLWCKKGLKCVLIQVTGQWLLEAMLVENSMMLS